MLALAAFFSGLIGLVLGTLGGGGAILMLPLLVHVLHLAPKPAIASSLVVIGATSLVGAAMHARAGRVRYRVAAIFGAGAMSGAYTGGRLAHYLRGDWLLLGFGAIMLVTAVAMLRPRRPTSPRDLSIGKLLGIGATVGLVSGLVGAGGGFLIVPALVIAGGLPMPEAVGTSLLIIAFQSAAGIAGQLTHVQVDLRLLAVLSLAAVIGTLIGSRLSRRIQPESLRRAFAYLVLLMGLLFTAAQIIRL